MLIDKEGHRGELAQSEFKSGGRVLFAATIGIALGAVPLPYAAMGHLILPLNQEYGWGRSEIQIAILVYSTTLTILAPLFGILIDKYGSRIVAIISTFLFSVSWIFIAITPSSLIVFYILWFLCAVLGGASAPVSWTRGVNAWFSAKRGLALSMALTGTGVAAILFNIMFPPLIGWLGWRAGIIVAGLLPLLISLPIAIAFFRERDVGLDATAPLSAVPESGIPFSDARRQPKFWLMFASFGLVGLAVGGVYVNLLPLLTDKGFSSSSAGLVVATMGASIIVGRLACGLLLDRFWAPMIALPMFSLPVLGCFLLLSPSIGMEVAIFSAILFGIASGAEIDIAAYMAVRHFGLLNYGRIYGILYASFAICSSLSAYIYGLSYDIFGSYNPSLLMAGASLVAASLLLFLTGPYPAAESPRGTPLVPAER